MLLSSTFLSCIWAHSVEAGNLIELSLCVSLLTKNNEVFPGFCHVSYVRGSKKYGPEL